jgi:WD40 repeat protein
MKEDEEIVWNPECPVAGHTGEVRSVDFSPDGKHFVSGSVDKLIKIWNTEAGTEVIIFARLRECGVVIRMSSAVFPSRFCLGSGLEIMMCGRQVRTLTGHSRPVRSVAFSPNGNRVVSGSDDKLVKIWDTETGAEVGSFVGVR